MSVQTLKDVIAYVIEHSAEQRTYDGGNIGMAALQSFFGVSPNPSPPKLKIKFRIQNMSSLCNYYK